MANFANDRNADLAKIHIAKKQLSMSREDYESMLWTQGRVTSSKDLDHAGRAKVLDYLKNIGFKAAAAKSAKRPSRPTPSADALPLVRGIRAQLISLGRLPDTYADGIAKQMLGNDAPEFFEWCTPHSLTQISQALTYQQNRTGAPTK